MRTFTQEHPAPTPCFNLWVLHSSALLSSLFTTQEIKKKKGKTTVENLGMSACSPYDVPLTEACLLQNNTLQRGPQVAAQKGTVAP